MGVKNHQKVLVTGNGGNGDISNKEIAPASLYLEGDPQILLLLLLLLYVESKH